MRAIMLQGVWTLLILIVIYGIVLAGLGRVMAKSQATRAHAIFWSFLAFGLASGSFAVVLWPNDSCVLPNFSGVWLGDWLYVHVIEWIGDPHSPQADGTIPWIFRVPQVYVMTSTGLFAAAGSTLQWFSGCMRR